MESQRNDNILYFSEHKNLNENFFDEINDWFHVTFITKTQQQQQQLSFRLFLPSIHSYPKFFYKIYAYKKEPRFKMQEKMGTAEMYSVEKVNIHPLCKK
jgi:hypothetical protein